jgi:hypothetical protein
MLSWPCDRCRTQTPPPKSSANLLHLDTSVHPLPPPIPNLKIAGRSLILLWELLSWGLHCQLTSSTQKRKEKEVFGLARTFHRVKITSQAFRFSITNHLMASGRWKVGQNVPRNFVKIPRHPPANVNDFATSLLWQFTGHLSNVHPMNSNCVSNFTLKLFWKAVQRPFLICPFVIKVFTPKLNYNYIYNE